MNNGRYRFSLRIWQTFRVRTRLLCWDKKWFFLEQVFIDRRNRHVAVGISGAALRSNGHWVSTQSVAMLERLFGEATQENHIRLEELKKKSAGTR